MFRADVLVPLNCFVGMGSTGTSACFIHSILLDIGTSFVRHWRRAYALFFRSLRELGQSSSRISGPSCGRVWWWGVRAFRAIDTIDSNLFQAKRSGKLDEKTGTSALVNGHRCWCFAFRYLLGSRINKSVSQPPMSSVSWVQVGLLVNQVASCSWFVDWWGLLFEAELPFWGEFKFLLLLKQPLTFRWESWWYRIESNLGLIIHQCTNSNTCNTTSCTEMILEHKVDYMTHRIILQGDLTLMISSTALHIESRCQRYLSQGACERWVHVIMFSRWYHPVCCSAYFPCPALCTIACIWATPKLKRLCCASFHRLLLIQIKSKSTVAVW